MANSVVLLSGDLMFASKVRVAAESAGWSFAMSGSVPEAGTDPAPTTIAVDLATKSSLLPGIVDEVQERFPNCKLIAYGPHVAVAGLKAAREAGIETVLTNGQFASDVMGWVA